MSHLNVTLTLLLPFEVIKKEIFVLRASELKVYSILNLYRLIYAARKYYL